MPLTLNAGSAGIDPDVAKAKADATPGKRSVFFHLTEGFDVDVVEGQGVQPQKALSAKGHVKVGLSGAKPTDGWQFGFVQLTKLIAGQAFYAGRTSREGSIAVMFERAMPAPLLLDSLPDRTPWTRSATRFQLVGSEIKCETEDHPALKVPRELRNSGRNVDNFLFHVIDTRLFWSVLTAIEPGGKRHHLAHFHWEVSHNVTFKWLAGKPLPGKKTSTFTLHRNAKGPPSESELAPLLASPAAPHFNVAAEKALIQSFLGARGPNRTENERWFSNVPNDFFS